MMRRTPAADRPEDSTTADEDDSEPVPRAAMVLIMVAFVALQATNSAAVAVMSVFVTQTLGLDVVWAGIALGVAAGAEIPAMLLLARLTRRFSQLSLISVGCVLGIGYYAGMAVVSGPVLLIMLQLLNAAFFATVAGLGLTLFQEIIPRPGLASGLYSNTRRIGAIVSGGLIGLATLTPMEYAGTFAACVALTVLALAMLVGAARVYRSG